MSENEIKPVAWVDLECWKATNDAGESFFTDYQDEETVALYDQSAIDALTKQISELKTMLSIAEFQRKEMQAERDAAVADAERYRWLKQASKAEYLIARGVFGLDDAAIDAARSGGGV